MNRELLSSGGIVYVTIECIHGRAFNLARLGEKSAILPVICAEFGLLGDNSAHSRRFECHPPNINPM